MKTTINIAEASKRLNFAALTVQLRNLVASGGSLRRPKLGMLLDQMREGLLEARAKGATFQSLTNFLKENGLPVSETTLRDYFRDNVTTTRKTRRPQRHRDKTAKPIAARLQQKDDTNRVPETPAPLNLQRGFRDLRGKF